MFCPECGTQNIDTARFCVSCGYQTPHAGGAAAGMRTHQVVASAPSSSGPNYLVIGGGVLALLVIAGLVGFIALRGSGASDQESSPTPRVKNAANTSAAASTPAPPASNAPTANTPAATTPNSTPNVATATPAPQLAAPKAAKKPVDCDKKCYQVYDQCMADYRQHPDPETICRGRQTTCLSKCG